MKYLLILLGLCLVACNNQKKNETNNKDNNTIIPDEYAWDNQPRVFFKFDRPVNGYTVKGMFFPKQEFAGKALLYFSKDNNNFVIYNEWFGNDYLDELSEEFQKTGEYYKDGDTITLRYTRDKEFLSADAPFFFQDVNFDGKTELLITNWKLGDRGLYHTYDVYKIGFGIIHLDSEPFVNPFGKLNNHNTDFDTINKKITIYNYDGIYCTDVYEYKFNPNQPELINRLKVVR